MTSRRRRADFKNIYKMWQFLSKSERAVARSHRGKKNDERWPYGPVGAAHGYLGNFGINPENCSKEGCWIYSESVPKLCLRQFALSDTNLMSERSLPESTIICRSNQCAPHHCLGDDGLWCAQDILVKYYSVRAHYIMIS